MNTYYWETEHANGNFQAESDEEALKQKPKDCWVLYREHDETGPKRMHILFENPGHI